MDSITVPRSVFVNGQWATAHWMADVVDESTGELVITATLAGVGDQGPVVTALRMDMALAQQLRAMAGFFKGEQLELDGSGESDCYDCRTNQQRLTELEEAIHADIRERIADGQSITRLETAERIAHAEVNARIAQNQTRVDALVHESAQMFSAIERRLDALEQLQKRYDRLMDSAASAHSLVMLSDRVAAIESILSFRGQFDRLSQIEDRLAALESEPAQDETLLTVDIMAAYDLIARRERASGGA